MLISNDIIKSYDRVKKYVTRTPILTSSYFDDLFGCKLYFKTESFQKVGAFKFRGAINALLSYKERHGNLPEKIVAFSSGNHAQATALAGKILGIKVRIYSPSFSSTIKIQASKNYGADVITTTSRIEAEELAQKDTENGYYLLKPFDDEDILLGQGTSCYEALHDLSDIDAIFATCGGGGWLSGSYLAKEALSPKTKIFGVEPEEADDAYRSYKDGRIIPLEKPTTTIADGARVLKVGEKTFPYLQKLDDFFTASEERIIYWTQWLNHILKVRIEPTSSVAMSGVEQWIEKEGKGKNILILLSGGNIDAATERLIWEKNYL